MASVSLLNRLDEEEKREEETDNSSDGLNKEDIKEPVSSLTPKALSCFQMSLNVLRNNFSTKGNDESFGDDLDNFKAYERNLHASIIHI